MNDGGVLRVLALVLAASAQLAYRMSCKTLGIYHGMCGILCGIL